MNVWDTFEKKVASLIDEKKFMSIEWNIQSKGKVYKNHSLRDYHLFFKENFAKYEKKVIKLKKNIPELRKDVTFHNLDYLIILKVI